jgi:hypothetical protein
MHVRHSFEEKNGGMHMANRSLTRRQPTEVVVQQCTPGKIVARTQSQLPEIDEKTARAIALGERPYGYGFVPRHDYVEMSDPRNEAATQARWEPILKCIGITVLGVRDLPTAPVRLTVEGIEWEVRILHPSGTYELPPHVYNRVRAAEAAEVPFAWYLWGEEQFARPTFTTRQPTRKQGAASLWHKRRLIDPILSLLDPILSASYPQPQDAGCGACWVSGSTKRCADCWRLPMNRHDPSIEEIIRRAREAGAADLHRQRPSFTRQSPAVSKDTPRHQLLRNFSLEKWHWCLGFALCNSLAGIILWLCSSNLHGLITFLVVPGFVYPLELLSENTRKYQAVATLICLYIALGITAGAFTFYDIYS